VTPEENNILSNTMASCLLSVHVCREMNPVKDQGSSTGREKSENQTIIDLIIFFSQLT
jgi:hypothetical protein